MITIPKNKVAVIPIYDAEETRGGIIKPSSFNYDRRVQRWDVYGTRNWDREPYKLDECESRERANFVISEYERKGYIKLYSQLKHEIVATEVLDSGERVDQGIVKYVGKDVVDVKIGDYVFFSGYTGTLVNVEGEGKLIILPEKFVEFTLDEDRSHMEIPGVYFRSKEGHYFHATYEALMNIVAETFTQTGKTIDATPSLPKLEDYNVR